MIQGRYNYAVHITTRFYKHHVSDLETCCTFLLCYCTLDLPSLPVCRVALLPTSPLLFLSLTKQSEAACIPSQGPSLLPVLSIFYFGQEKRAPPLNHLYSHTLC